MTHALTRRSVLGGAAAVGGAALLAACGSDTADEATGGDTATDGGSATQEPNADDGAGALDGALVSTSDVPVGGGVIVAASQVVVTQPTEGDFKAFSSTCTHQGCQVSSVSDEQIVCACHNSRFSIADGSVLGGPATAPLPEVSVSVSGDQVVSA
jgi:Rieske Fe-S protein